MSYKVSTLTFSNDSAHSSLADGVTYSTNGNKIYINVIDNFVDDDDNLTVFVITDMADKNEVAGYYWAVGYLDCSISEEGYELSTEEYYNDNSQDYDEYEEAEKAVEELMAELSSSDE